MVDQLMDQSNSQEDSDPENNIENDSQEESSEVNHHPNQSIKDLNITSSTSILEPTKTYEEELAECEALYAQI